MRAKLIKESMGDILTPKSEDDIIKQFSNLYQEEKGEKLIEASWNDEFYLVELLIKAGSNVNYKNKYGETALMHASANGYLDIVQLLIENGADINTKNIFGDTALKIAYNNDHMNVISLLLKKLRNIK